MNNTPINLPIPNNLSRQVGVSDIGSPIVLSRGSSVNSVASQYQETPDEAMRRRLLAYKIHVEHDMEFIGQEIEALSQRVRTDIPQDEAALDELHDGLKIRYNKLQTRLSRIQALLEVL